MITTNQCLQINHLERTVLTEYGSTLVRVLALRQELSKAVTYLHHKAGAKQRRALKLLPQKAKKAAQNHQHKPNNYPYNGCQ